jgi:hypothetical protein
MAQRFAPWIACLWSLRPQESQRDTYHENFENLDPSPRRTFSDPAPPRFAAGTGGPEKSPMRASRDPISKLRKGLIIIIRSG